MDTPSITISKSITVLEEIQPLCQLNTRLGGQTLMELAILYWENEQYENSLEILLSLVDNVHMQRSYNLKKLIRQLQSVSSSGESSMDPPPPPPPTSSRRKSSDAKNIFEQMMMTWQQDDAGGFFSRRN